jgi:hypothetical protein
VRPKRATYRASQFLVARKAKMKTIAKLLWMAVTSAMVVGCAASPQPNQVFNTHDVPFVGWWGGTGSLVIRVDGVNQGTAATSGAADINCPVVGTVLHQYSGTVWIPSGQHNVRVHLPGDPTSCIPPVGLTCFKANLGVYPDVCLAAARCQLACSTPITVNAP